MALDSTAGSASANSYTDVASADDYFSLRPYATAWTTLPTTAAKEAALVTATRRIDEELFDGRKASTTQALKWPRVDTYDDDGISYSSTAIPAKVKEANYMMALEILKTDFLQENYLSNYSYLQSSTTAFKQFQPGTSGALPASVKRLLRGLLKGYGPTLDLVRG